MEHGWTCGLLVLNGVLLHYYCYFSGCMCCPCQIILFCSDGLRSQDMNSGLPYLINLFFSPLS
uniref:Uncharacterized protein n=1 Tax=Rhizophora mucronata TaxID=61149 RepID=A0A2P2N195_RHIMU